MSGESGSGKTEATKLMMAHLASIAGGGGGSGSTDGGGDDESGGDRTIERVLQSNPLLESFGNAQTVRNDNSSRFGRFTQLQFRRRRSGSTKGEALVGSQCVTYLLEKSRVVHHSIGERTYHIFYQLLAAPEADKARVGLGGKAVGSFRYLACDHGGSETTVIEGRSDAARYAATRRALGLVGVEEEWQWQVLTTLAAILYLGEVDFVSEEGASGDEEARVRDPAALAEAAGLLGCDPQALGKALCARTVRTRSEEYSVPMTPGQAVDAREALSKEVYARLFAWLVARINGSMAVVDGSAAGAAAEGGGAAVRTIGLLDIFGFESFAVNRFEQLCINYCNGACVRAPRVEVVPFFLSTHPQPPHTQPTERLQQRFTTDVFKSVQLEYEEEGIAWAFVPFPDNTPVLELIEGRMGLITVLNEECMLAKGGDAAFTSKLSSLHEEHPHFSRDRLNRLDFCIHHYAGRVKYTAANFVARNRDTLLEDLAAAVGRSSVPLIRELFPATGNGRADGDGDRRRKKGGGAIVAESVVTKFRRQLTDLMGTVARTRVQYIRCVKPNQAKSATALEPLMVMEQLRCAGVIEAIRISRAAYPNRLAHVECLRRFCLLHADRADQQAAGRALKGDGNGAGAAEAVAEAVRRLLREQLPASASASAEGDGEEQRRQRWEMGRMRVYFAKGALEELEERRLAVLARNATAVQRCIRGWQQRRAYQRQRRAAVVLQSRLRGWRQLRWYLRERARVVRLQALWRRAAAAARVRALRLRKRATTLQRHYRGHWHRARYTRLRGGVVRLQALARGKAARRAYVAALAEAKEQAKMENQLEALRKRLEEESEARRAAEAALRERAATGTGEAAPQAGAAAAGLDGSVAGLLQAVPTAQALSEEQGQMLEVGWVA